MPGLAVCWPERRAVIVHTAFRALLAVLVPLLLSLGRRLDRIDARLDALTARVDSLATRERRPGAQHAAGARIMMGALLFFGVGCLVAACLVSGARSPRPSGVEA